MQELGGSFFRLVKQLLFPAGQVGDAAGLKKIAQAAGIQGASFYNHYAGKEELLNEIYNYYEKHYFMNVKPLDEIRDILKTGTAEEIIKVIAWNFYGLPIDIHHRMTIITKMIYSRLLIDGRANQIFINKMTTETIDEFIGKLQALAQYGRLKEGLDLKSFAEVTVYTGLMTGIVGIANNYTGGLIDAKQYLKGLLADYLAHNLKPGS